MENHEEIEKMIRESLDNDLVWKIYSDIVVYGKYCPDGVIIIEEDSDGQ